MAAIGNARVLTKTKGESNLTPLLGMGEARNLSRNTIDRLTETMAGIDAVAEALRVKGVDLEGLAEPSSILSLAVAVIAGVPMEERASRTGAAVIYNRDRHRRFAIAAVRGRYGRSGGTYAASRPKRGPIRVTV